MNTPYYDAWDSTPPTIRSCRRVHFAFAALAVLFCAQPASVQSIPVSRESGAQGAIISDSHAGRVDPRQPAIKTSPRREGGWSAYTAGYLVASAPTLSRPAGASDGAGVQNAGGQEPTRLFSGNPIVGPTGGQPGDILLLDASQAKAKSYAWECIPPAMDAQGKPLVTIVPLGERAIVSSRPGSRTVILACVDEAGKVSLYQWPITVGGPQPIPPEPAPPKPPEPKPEPLTGLAKVAFDEAAKLADKSKAPALAQAFRGLVQKIMDGAVADDVQAIALIKAATNQALGAQTDLWKPWGNAVGAALRVKDPNTPNEWAAAVEQIAVGLEAIK